MIANMTYDQWLLLIGIIAVEFIAVDRLATWAVGPKPTPEPEREPPLPMVCGTLVPDPFEGELIYHFADEPTAE